MQYEILLYFIIFLYGTVFGSFLNVLIYRLPLKENIATEHSHCMTCGEKIQWYDLIPLVSYIILGGKCRHCKTKISKQYPIIEATNGIAYVIIFIVNGFNPLSILMCFAFSIFLVISVILIGCILGAVIHSIRMKVTKAEHVLAFGPYLCAGLTIAMLFGTNIINWYLSLMAF